MEETLQELQIRYEEKSLKAAEFAKKAAELTHTVITAGRKSQKALDAIGTHDKATMWWILANNFAKGKNWVDFESEIREIIEFLDHQISDLYLICQQNIFFFRIRKRLLIYPL